MRYQNPVIFRVQPYRNFIKNRRSNYFKYITRFEREKEKGMYIDYITKREGASGIFDMAGKTIEKDQLKAIQKEFAYSKGMVWDIVISFDTKFAYDYHITNTETAKQVLSNELTRMFYEQGIRLNNLNSFFSFHTNTDNPHIQGVIYEKQPERFNPKIRLELFQQLKTNITLNVYHNLKWEPKVAPRNELEVRLQNYLNLQKEKLLDITPLKIKEYVSLQTLVENKVTIPSLQYFKFKEYEKTMPPVKQLLANEIFKEYKTTDDYKEMFKNLNMNWDEIRNSDEYKSYESSMINTLKQEILANKDDYILTPQQEMKYYQNITIEPETSIKHDLKNLNIAYEVKKISYSLARLCSPSKSLVLRQVKMLRELEQDRQLAKEKGMELEY